MLYILIIVLVGFSFGEAQLNYTVIHQNRPLSSSFDEIIVDGLFNVHLEQKEGDSPPSVDIESVVYAQPQIIVEILDNHTLSLRIQGSLTIKHNIKAKICFSKPLRRYIMKGTGNTVTEDPGLFNNGTEKFQFENRGTANVAMRLNYTSFEVIVSGTGNSRFWGQIRERAVFEARGVGDINALNLVSKEVVVISTGVSTVRVSATDDVKIRVTGVSNVYYRLPAGKKPSETIATGLGQIIPVH